MNDRVPTTRELVAQRKANALETATVADYLNEQGGPEGRFCKFKAGAFIVTDTGQEMDVEANYRVLYRETRASWKKFVEGQSPEVIGGLIFDGFTLPRREELGDADPSGWDIGLSGKPVDPWNHFLEIVLERVDTKEVFLFGTSSHTGRKAVAALLKNCNRAGSDLIVKLAVGSFKHKDARIGTVFVPSFVVVADAKRTGAAPVLDDAVPF
jgi:hypothetical protein